MAERRKDGRAKNGGRRAGSGRKKGTPNRNTAKTRDELWAYVAEQNKTNPLQFLLDCVHDTDLEMSLRTQCAQYVTPYMASKLQPVDPASGKAEQKMRITVQLSGDHDSDD